MVTPRKAYSAVNWAHQQREWNIGREKRKRALNWPMRSGKSKAVIDKVCYQYERDNVMGVVVIAPNGVHLNWADNEIPKWSWPEHGEPKIFAWSTPNRGEWDKIEALVDITTPCPQLRWFCVNMEALDHEDCRAALKTFVQSLPDADNFERTKLSMRARKKLMMAVSEAHHFGHTGSKRTFKARSLALWADFVMTETGTPILNSPLRAFSQYELLEPKALGFETYTDFERHFAIKKEVPNTRRMNVVGYQNLPELTRALAKWTSVVTRDEVRDMPTLIRTERPVVMGDEQRRQYLKMVEQHLIEIGDAEIAAEDAGARMVKLQQIVNGYIMKDGAIHNIEERAPIYRALLDEVDGTMPGKCLIWCRFKEDIKRVIATLTFAGHRCVEYSGRVPLHEREKNRHAFNNDKRIHCCVGQPQAGGEGLDFSGADAVLYFSCVPNTITMVQSEERATVVGGKPVAIVRIRTHGTVDDRLWKIVDSNIELADAVSGRGLRDILAETNV